MCGLCGYVGFQGRRPAPEAHRAMTEVLSHRGPDATGKAVLPGAGVSGWMGHRRLKIVDLTEAASQPMVGGDGNVVLVYNGEVYNFEELRQELQGLGARFVSTGDTEVVLRAYETWGEGFLTRIDGMFALAVWDARTQTLLLARDRTGKKPLFYAAAEGALVFGSEIKAILASGWVERRLASEHLPEFLTYGYVPWPNTLYERILQVPPACYVRFDRHGLSQPIRYWDFLPTEQPVTPTTSVLTEIRDLLHAATRRRLVSDVPLGALLSGGIDSSIVVGLMSQLANEPVHTFSIGFPEDQSFDERSHARTVASHFGTQHREFAVRMDAVALLDRLLWHHDQPFADSSAIPTYLVSQLARRYVTVVLNGDGGDEVFGGYDRFVAAAIASRVPAAAIRPAKALTRLMPRGHGYYSYRRRAERFLERAGSSVHDRYQSWIAVANEDLLGSLLAPGAAGSARIASVRAAMDREYERASSYPVLDQILFANFATYLPDDLAVKMDRMTMAHSLEARSPFLDTALIEFVARIPAARKVGLRQLKPLLRHAFYPLLPRAIWQRRKHGFGVPMGRWFRGDLGELFADEVLSGSARCLNYLDRGALESLFADHRAGRREHGFRLWPVLTLERWLRALEEPLVLTPPRAADILDASERRQIAAGA